MLLLLIVVKREKQNRKKRSACVEPWLTRRTEFGAYSNLLNEFRIEDLIEYQKFLRISPEIFDELLGLIRSSITKQNTVMRDALSPSIKLAATIRFLVTGASYTDLQHLFRINKSTLARIIPEVCSAIYENLKDQYMQVSIFFTRYKFKRDFSNSSFLAMFLMMVKKPFDLMLY